MGDELVKVTKAKEKIFNSLYVGQKACFKENALTYFLHFNFVFNRILAVAAHV